MAAKSKRNRSFHKQVHFMAYFTNMEMNSPADCKNKCRLQLLIVNYIYTRRHHRVSLSQWRIMYAAIECFAGEK